MKRSKHEGAVTVIRWGTATRFADRVPEAVIAQLRLAHDLRNELVAIELRYERAKAAIWATKPDIAEADARLDVAVAALEDIKAQVQHERQEDRTTRARPATATALKAARAEVSEAKAARKAIRDAQYPVIAPFFHAAHAGRDDAIKGLYRVFSQERGLYWATHNAVVAHHDTSLGQIAAKRKAGEKAELHFHRWSGEGTLAVQLQRQVGDPPRSPEVLASSASKWRNVVAIPALADGFEEMSRGDRRRAARQVVKVRIGTAEDRSPIWWEIPVMMHRPLPADADVTGVEVTRRRVAGHSSLSVAVTCLLAGPVGRTEGAMVGLDVGWRALSDGALRVGVIHVQGAIEHPPAHPCIRALGGGVEVVIPASWRDIHAHLEKLDSIRDGAFDTARDSLAAWLEERGDVAAMWELTPARLREWRSPGRLAGLCLRWRNERFRGDAEAYGALEAWRVQDRHLWEWERNERKQLIARRTDAWRIVGSWLASSAATIRLGAWDIASVRRQPAVGAEDTEQARAARHNATLAAPGALRTAVVQAAKRSGVMVERSEAARLGITHFACGSEAADRSAAAERIVLWCEACGTGFDQDANAARWLASGRVPNASS